jgi:hypothetical protein
MLFLFKPILMKALGINLNAPACDQVQRAHRAERTKIDRDLFAESPVNLIGEGLHQI